MQSKTHDESLLSLKWRYTAGECRQGYTPADGMSIEPTRCASSMIESDSSPSATPLEATRQVQEEDHAPTRPRWCLLWRSWHR
jgi:hypothetical protein